MHHCFFEQDKHCDHHLPWAWTLFLTLAKRCSKVINRHLLPECIKSHASMVGFRLFVTHLDKEKGLQLMSTCQRLHAILWLYCTAWWMCMKPRFTLRVVSRLRCSHKYLFWLLEGALMALTRWIFCGYRTLKSKELRWCYCYWYWNSERPRINTDMGSVPIRYYSTVFSSGFEAANSAIVLAVN